jgi:hypothetical protein
MYVDTVLEIYWADEVVPGYEDDSFTSWEEAMLKACETMKLRGERQLTAEPYPRALCRTLGRDCIPLWMR